MRLKYFILISYFSFLSLHFSFGQKWIWANNGKGGLGWANAVTTDVKGNVYAVGEFGRWSPKISFGTDTLINKGYCNTFLVKYNSKGKLLWAVNPRGRDSSITQGFSVATDTHGNVFITGEYTDTTYFGSTMLVASPREYYEAFIAKYDSNGNALWAKGSRQKSGGVMQSFGVTTDKSGNSYITGSTNDSVWFDSYGLTLGVFLVKFDSSGKVVWAKGSGGTGVSSTYMTIKTDEFDNIYFTGSYDAPISFGSFNLPFSSSTANVFLVKYDTAGNVKWATNSGGSSTATGVSVATYGAKGVYIAGWYEKGTLNFETDTLQTVGNQAFVFLVKYDTAGKVIWAKNSYDKGGYNTITYGVASDKKGDAFLYGISDTNISFGNDTLRSATVWKNADFIVEFDSSGNLICDTVLGNIGNLVWLSNAVGIAIDPTTQELCFGGVLDNFPYVLGNDTLSATNYCPYVAKWRPCNDFTGINELKPLTAKVSVYPNPNKGTFTIALQNVNETAQVEVYNVLGEVIYKEKLTMENIQVNLEKQPQGIYLYRVLDENSRLIGSGKLIIEK